MSNNSIVYCDVIIIAVIVKFFDLMPALITRLHLLINTFIGMTKTFYWLLGRGFSSLVPSSLHGLDYNYTVKWGNLSGHACVAACFLLSLILNSFLMALFTSHMAGVVWQKGPVYIAIWDEMAVIVWFADGMWNSLAPCTHYAREVNTVHVKVFRCTQV